MNYICFCIEYYEVNNKKVCSNCVKDTSKFKKRKAHILIKNCVKLKETIQCFICDKNCFKLNSVLNCYLCKYYLLLKGEKQNFKKKLLFELE